jgi:hypothetical protein
MDALKQKYNEQIKSLVPISGLAPQYQNEAIHKAQILKFKKKQKVFKQGDVDPYSYYLLEGELELESNGALVKTVKGGSMDAQSPLSQLQPRQMSASSPKLSPSPSSASLMGLPLPDALRVTSQRPLWMM